MSPKIVATVDDLTFEFRKESIIENQEKINEIAGGLPMASTRINLR